MDGFKAVFVAIDDAIQMATEPTMLGVTGWFLAIIFIISGFMKLRKPTLAAMAIVDFGVVKSVRPPLGAALGGVEASLAIGIILVPKPFITVSAVLLWIFTLLIGRSLLSGKTFACFCFGDAESALSVWTLSRTGALAILATAAVPSAVWTTNSFDAAEYTLQAVSAAALFGLISLSGYVSDLLRWNASQGRY